MFLHYSGIVSCINFAYKMGLCFAFFHAKCKTFQSFSNYVGIVRVGQYWQKPLWSMIYRYPSYPILPCANCLQSVTYSFSLFCQYSQLTFTTKEQMNFLFLYSLFTVTNIKKHMFDKFRNKHWYLIAIWETPITKPMIWKQTLRHKRSSNHGILVPEISFDGSKDYEPCWWQDFDQF